MTHNETLSINRKQYQNEITNAKQKFISSLPIKVGDVLNLFYIDKHYTGEKKGTFYRKHEHEVKIVRIELDEQLNPYVVCVDKKEKGEGYCKKTYSYKNAYNCVLEKDGKLYTTRSIQEVNECYEIVK